MDKIRFFLKTVDEILWGPGMLFLLLGTGCYLMIRLHFLPLRNLKFAMLCIIGKENAASHKMYSGDQGKPKDRRNKTIEKAGGVSSFASLTTELAATIGTGNIVGVATALVLGGPGALFWMIVSSVVGLATKLTESTLAVKYRSHNERGEIVGGPMYVMEKVFPNKRLGKMLGSFFAVFTVMASFGMGNMTQSNSIAEAMRAGFEIPEALSGLFVTVATILVVLGGIGTIAKVTQIMVPFMGVFYLLGALAVIVTHFANIPEAIRDIFVMAFQPQAIAGSLFGNMTISAQQALRFGVSRGVFSNEAGLGASGISAAAANTSDYVKQGYISMTGVFIDTIIICSITGLAYAASGVVGMKDAAGQMLNGTVLTIAAFQTSLGEKAGMFISICIVLFAFATIIAWAYQGEKAFEFLVKKSKYGIWYRFVYALIAFVGCVCSLEVVWDFADICNALMAMPNLICVLVLSGDICRDIKEYGRK